MHELDGHTKSMHHYQESLVGGPPYFEDIEISSYGLVTISNSHFYLHVFLSLIVGIF